jgi:hypothetical protein
MLEIEKGSTRARGVENSLSKESWTFLKTDYGMIKVVVVVVVVVGSLPSLSAEDANRPISRNAAKFQI